MRPRDLGTYSCCVCVRPVRLSFRQWLSVSGSGGCCCLHVLNPDTENCKLSRKGVSFKTTWHVRPSWLRCSSSVTPSSHSTCARSAGSVRGRRLIVGLICSGMTLSGYFFGLRNPGFHSMPYHFNHSHAKPRITHQHTRAGSSGVLSGGQAFTAGKCRGYFCAWSEVLHADGFLDIMRSVLRPRP